MSGVFNKGIFIIGAKRTPFTPVNGRLRKISATDLQVISARAAIRHANVQPEQIDLLTIGNVIPLSSTDSFLLPRHVALKTGIPLARPSYALNMLCGTGFQAVISGATAIEANHVRVSLAGGTENLSSTPLLARNVRYGVKPAQKLIMEDPLWDGLYDSMCGMNVGEIAENVAAILKIEKLASDTFAVRSQRLWSAAEEDGLFCEEIVEVNDELEPVVRDENVKALTTMDVLDGMPKIFKSNGIITAGTTAALCDGSAAIVLADESTLNTFNRKPLSRIVAYVAVGVEPSLMGLGPVAAINKLLEITGRNIAEIDLIEINEAFAAQVLACTHALDLNVERVNKNGGAIACGHVHAATGLRLLMHLAYELKRTNKRFGIASTCIGGGQGYAVMIENQSTLPI